MLQGAAVAVAIADYDRELGIDCSGISIFPFNDLKPE